MTLAALVGNPGTRRLLTRLVAASRLPHALVLEGPCGCGRRTMARALAMSLLCPSRIAGDACGACAHCRQAAAGTHPDLSELPGRREAASGIPVEAAREVAQRAAVSPLLGVAKAIIIPDAERLRDAAANALLKVLEEPPAGTTIVLTATAAAGLIGTIRSRAQVFRLSALSPDEVAQVLVGRGVAPDRARILAGGGAGVDAVAADAPPPPPLAELRRILAGLDLSAIAGVLRGLPDREASTGEGEGRTAAAVQRAVLRTWLQALAQDLRPELRSRDPAVAGATVAGLGRIAQACADLDRNHQPRLVLETLALGA